MVCYAVPMLAAFVHYGLRKNVTTWKHSTHHLWLNLLFVGASMFGVIDHLWNGELFLISENIFWDLMLGVVITIGIVAGWILIVALTQKQSDQIKASS